MKFYYFLKSFLKDTFITMIVAVASFAVVLVTTLNMTAATLVFLLFLSVAIFQKSFSRGWLFLLAVLLVLPSMKISGTAFTVHDLFLVILGIVGLAVILVENAKIPLLGISYYLFLMELVGASILIFAKLFNQQIDPLVSLMMILLGMYWVATNTFQYFFQTMKRLRRFFLLLITIGLLHSVFGIITYLIGFQTPTGLGISSGKMQFLFIENVRHQVNGFLGDGYVSRVGENPLVPFLLLTIPLTCALFLLSKKKAGTERPLSEIEKTASFFQVILERKKHLKLGDSFIENLNKKRKSINKEKLINVFSSKFFIGIILAIQLTALLLTFSYSSLIILAIGLFFMAILFRNKRAISFLTGVMIFLTIVLPSFSSPGSEVLGLGTQNWFNGWDLVQKNLVWGGGWKSVGGQISESGTINNSYFLIWNHFGIFGIILFAIILWKYLKEIYENYRTSDGDKRVWLITIFAIFLEFLLIGFISNSFFFGPAALVFWLLYGAVENLRRKQMVFGITETKLSVDENQTNLF